MRGDAYGSAGKDGVVEFVLSRPADGRPLLRPESSETATTPCDEFLICGGGCVLFSGQAIVSNSSISSTHASHISPGSRLCMCIRAPRHLPIPHPRPS